jgi:signal transduction histidine kinase
MSIIIKPLNLVEYINKTISTIKNFNSETNANVINNVPEYVTINFNPAYLESVLLNFVTNAIRYAHPDRDPIIIFDYTIEKEGYKVLKIKDNGLGIDLDAYGDLLFGMYRTFHKHKDARGIGLHITKNQIEAMNGKVFVESEVGVGTTFKIVFSDEL